MNHLYNAKIYYSSLVSGLYFDFEVKVVARDSRDARRQAWEKIKELNNDDSYLNILSVEKGPSTEGKSMFSTKSIKSILA